MGLSKLLEHDTPSSVMLFWYVHTRASSGNKMEGDSGPSGKMEDLV